jgi:hypothetical protein
MGRKHIDLSEVVTSPVLTVDVDKLMAKKYNYIPLFTSLEFKNLCHKLNVDYKEVVRECEEDMNNEIKDPTLDQFIDLEEGWDKVPSSLIVKHTFRRTFC